MRAFLVELDRSRGIGIRGGNRSIGDHGAGIVLDLELEGGRYEVGGAGHRLEGAEIAGGFRIGERHPVADRRGVFDYRAGPRKRTRLLTAPCSFKGCLESRIGRLGDFVRRSNRDVLDRHRFVVLESNGRLATDNVQSPLFRRAATAQGVRIVYRSGSQFDLELEGERIIRDARNRFLYLQAPVRPRVLRIGDGDVSVFAVVVLPLEAAFHSRNRVFDHAILIVAIGIQPGEGVEPRVAAIEDDAVYIGVSLEQANRDRRGIRAFVERLPHRKSFIEIAGVQSAVAGYGSACIIFCDVSLEHHGCGVPCPLLVRLAYLGSEVFAGDDVLVSAGFE